MQADRCKFWYDSSFFSRIFTIFRPCSRAPRACAFVSGEQSFDTGTQLEPKSAKRALAHINQMHMRCGPPLARSAVAKIK